MSNVKIEHVTFYKVGHRSFETIQDAEAYIEFGKRDAQISALKERIDSCQLLSAQYFNDPSDLLPEVLENALKVAQAIVEFVKQVRESENVTGS